MEETPFYNPGKTYYQNLEEGPFGVFADSNIYKQKNKPKFEFMGHKVYAPFGIPAGPLINGNFVKAALDKGFDIPVYKTVRTQKHPCHQWPNVLPVDTENTLTLEKAKQGLTTKKTYSQPVSITNSFGVPSFDPDFWQEDLADAVKHAKEGQVVIGSFQGTQPENGGVNKYINDFVTAARLVKETGAKILEVNLSCPNEGTAHLLCFDVERTRSVAEAIKNEIGNTPLIVKTAYFEDGKTLKKFVNEVGSIVDGIASINTIPTEVKDKRGNQALPGEGRLVSGVCGHSIKWAGLDMVKRLNSLREELDSNYSIVGVGGVTTPEDYKEYIQAGADAVMSATGAMWNPYLAQEIKNTIDIKKI